MQKMEFWELDFNRLIKLPGSKMQMHSTMGI